jgi:cytochrome c oxidase subunit II
MKDPRDAQDASGAAAQTHFTARRGFVAAAGFGMVSLYLLWAGYGAAPLGFGAHDAAEDGHAPEAGGHGGGHGGAAQASFEEFKAEVERFVGQYKLPDGSVQPRRTAAAAAAAHGHGAHDAHAAAPAPAGPAGPIDVYLMAYQFGFMPAVLRLEAGVAYRFRMMAVDVAHGASVRIGPAARVVRLRPGVLVEQELNFQRAGEHLLYCTVYCGLAHDRMQGKIVVTERRAGS